MKTQKNLRGVGAEKRWAKKTVSTEIPEAALQREFLKFERDLNGWGGLEP